jgi:hypothetical protein
VTTKEAAVQAPGRPAYRGEDLIFLISQPKAGSTLLQRLLAGHPDIQTSAETWLMLNPVYGLRSSGINTEYNARWAAESIREFLDYYADGEETYREGVRRFAESIYGSVLAKSGKRYFLDKTPRYTMIVDELYRLFPAAKYVILLRNPLAILNSELDTYVKGDWPILAEFRPDLLNAPLRLIEAREQLGDAAFEIRYEDLVSAPEESIEALCSYLGISFHKDMLDYADTPAPKGRMNDPVGIHRHTRPSTASLGKWKAMREDPQLRHFAVSYVDALGDATLAALGYDPDDLRRAMGSAASVGKGPTVYPWDLAITHHRGWSLRQQVQDAYISGALDGSKIRGVFSAAGVFLGRLFSSARRMTVQPAAGQAQGKGDTPRGARR